MTDQQEVDRKLSEGTYERSEVLKEAELSADRAYRYRLSRSWAGGPRVTFVMLNPSTADERADDPTLRRCLGFARRWGFDGVNIVNLYAFRATRPADLWKIPDPVGPENDDFLRAAGASGGLLVAAWGNHAKPERIQEVFAIPGFDDLHYLQMTKQGQPHHPLLLKSELSPCPWPKAER